MAIHFKATQINDRHYAITIPALAERPVADVRLNENGEWTTETRTGAFWVRSGTVTKFPDQPAAEAALGALAKWGNDHIEVVVPTTT